MKGALTQSRAILLVLAILASGILGGTEACARRGAKVRVVLITLDTLRYDSFAGIDGSSPTMPRLREWAEKATIFDRFYTSTASTQPSHASMFTGLHPWQHGVSRNGMQLADEHETVAERLSEAGFTTAAVVASFPVSRRFGFAQGFDQFRDDFVAGQVHRGEWFRAAQRSAGENGAAAQPEDPFYSLADLVTERALALLDAAKGRRQFFWFHYFDPHDPYGDTTEGPTVGPGDVLRLAASGQDPMPALAEARRRYDADVAFLDRALARLLERLESDATELETHVVIVADHGESFGEEGSMAHGRRLIPSQLHVPCVVRSPRLTPGVRRDVASSIDVAATLLTLAGVKAELARSQASRDLTRPSQRPPQAFGMRRSYDVPYQDRRLDGSVQEIDGHLFFFLNENGELFRGNKDTLIPPAGRESGLPREETQKLQRLFSEFEEDLARHQAAGDPDPEVKEKLEALGYLD